MNPPEPAGYVMVEVLIAMAILMSGILLISESYSYSLRALSQAEQGAQAATLLEGRVLEEEHVLRPTAPANRNGVLGSLKWQKTDRAMVLRWESRGAMRSLELHVDETR